MESQPSQAPFEPTGRAKGSWLLKTLLALVIIVATLAVVIAMQPSTFAVTRTAKIEAPPEAVFAQVNDFHNWEAWSPWAKRDPNAKNSYAGPEAGKGATFRWAGNDEVGEGQMTIVESRPHELIEMKLDFIKPYESTCNTKFTFQPQGDQTEVTWSMSGKNSFMEKAICMFMDMDQMVGGDFEQGLANMKQVVESNRNNSSPELPPATSGEEP